MLEAATTRGQPADHLLLAGPPGLGKTRMAGIVAAEMGVHLHITSGPGARTRRRPGRDPHQARRGRRAVHRRDPPAVAGRRGDPVSGDGGLPARHRRRQGPGGVEHPPDAAAVHARRRHHPHRHDHRAAARPLRARRPARLLRRRRARGDRAPRRRHPATSTSTTTGRGRSPAASRGTPRIANRLLRRVRDYAEVRGDGTHRRGHGPRRAASCSASTSAASTRSTGRSSPRSASSSAAARSGSRTLAISVGEQPETVEDMYEPFLIQQGMIARTPRGRIAMPAAFEHLGLPAPVRARAVAVRGMSGRLADKVALITGARERHRCGDGPPLRGRGRAAVAQRRRSRRVRRARRRAPFGGRDGGWFGR